MNRDGIITVGAFLITCERISEDTGTAELLDSLKQKLHEKLESFWRASIQDRYMLPLIGGEKLEIIVKPLGWAGTQDPLDQRASIGMKTDLTDKILREESFNKYHKDIPAWRKEAADKYAKARTEGLSEMVFSWAGWVR